MSEWDELYMEVILDHNKNPRNKGVSPKGVNNPPILLTKKMKNTTGFVTKSVFELQFGFEYPKVPPTPMYIKTIKYN